MSTANLESQHPAAFQFLRLSKYAFRLGLFRGPAILLRLAAARGEPVTVDVPRMSARVQVRPHSSDVTTFEKIFISREYDLSGFPIQARTILDLGANVGYASVYFASQFPRAKIIAVEPEAANFRLLEQNTARFPNVHCINAAVWPTPAKVSISNPDAQSWAFKVEEASPANDGASIRGITINEIRAEQGITTIDVLKIDIEGAEKELFGPGCEDWLEHTRVIITELHDWLRPGCGTAFFRATSKLDFNYFNVGENTLLVRDIPAE